MKRRQGCGSITPMPDGRFWVRSARQLDGSRPSLGYYDTREEAERKALIGSAAIVPMRKDGCTTFELVGKDVLDQRELDGIRGISQERYRFALHLETAHFAGQPIDKITSVDIAEWLRAMQRKKAADRRGVRLVSRSTIQRALALCSVIFDEAGPQGRGLVDVNPCLGMKVRAKSGAVTEEPWTFLTLEEQRAIGSCAAMAPADRLAILFAIGTGLRQGEQFNLELRDLHVDGPEPRVVVRFGSAGKAPKSGKIRTVPLFGIALEAAAEWLKVRARTGSRLVFRSPTGCRRAVGKPLGNGTRIEGRYVDRFDTVLALAGITRSVRWHDLRHTCASSLVSGFWGQPWSLEEVKAMLGHSSILVTQRYAHLGETALKNAARKVVGLAGIEPATRGLKGPCAAIAPQSLVGDGLVDGGGPSASSLAAISTDIVQLGFLTDGSASKGLKGPSVVELLRGLALENNPGNQLVTNLAATLAAMLEARS